MDKLYFPCPDRVRRNWLDLRGTWQFCFDDENTGWQQFTDPAFFDKEIQVPYSYHTKNSGLEIKEDHPIVWYKKTFSLDVLPEQNVLLHFEAVDYLCHVYVNGHFAGMHQGGHTPFTLEISRFLEEENEIVVRVEDYTRCNQPIGKQSWKDHNFLCWYTRTIGIWQSVWLEVVGSSWISSFKITPEIDDAKIDVDMQIEGKEDVYLVGQIYFQGRLLNTFSSTFKSRRARISVDVSDEEANFRLHFWSCADPNLYDIRFSLFSEQELQDEVESYFGMRKIERKDNQIYLNNQLFYQKLILDQGYFKDGGLSATADELKKDVELIKAMGFNGARKHQKIEDARYMYLCDVLGLVMWAEMPSSFEYSSLANENTVRELYAFVDKHYNHPSVICYTLLNESWGINEVYSNKAEQYFVQALYSLVKSLDPSRLVIGNDGWEQAATDILAIHDYNNDPASLKESYKDLEKAAKGTPSKTSLRHCFAQGFGYENHPFMISEYGGIAYDTGTNEQNESWGYGTRLTDPNEILEKIAALTKAVFEIEGLCGFCYTQLSDVEQEINGLLDHNHEPKFDPAKIAAIFSENNHGFIFE
jgi:beta-galactosidase/beta-glucuronidase